MVKNTGQVLPQTINYSNNRVIQGDTSRLFVRIICQSVRNDAAVVKGSMGKTTT